MFYCWLADHLQLSLISNLLFIFYLFTGIRDYVHVMDLAEGHVAALKKLQSNHVHLQVGIYNYFMIIKIFLFNFNYLFYSNIKF